MRQPAAAAVPDPIGPEIWPRVTRIQQEDAQAPIEIPIPLTDRAGLGADFSFQISAAAGRWLPRRFRAADSRGPRTGIVAGL